MGVITGPLFDRGYGYVQIDKSAFGADLSQRYHLVIGGSVILIASLFLLSLAQPEKYYQVRSDLFSLFGGSDFSMETFLSQGLGVGIGSSLSYVPSLAVQAHHFHSAEARAQAMGLAVAGVPVAGIVHPILLDSLLHRSGESKVQAFRTATRASAGLVTGLQIISILLLRTKYDERNERRRLEARRLADTAPRRLPQFVRTALRYASDWPYVCIVTGWA